MINKYRLKPKFELDLDQINAYVDCVSDLLKHERVQSMKNFIQHGNTTCFDHSLYVSFTSYVVSRRLGLDYRATARGALLHDFFLYDWHIKGNSEGLHGFSHPRVALRNALESFELGAIEREIILKHMWPLTPALPLKKEAVVVTMVDKYCSIAETVKFKSNSHIKHLQSIVV
jgi:uncharacterized protein